MQYTNYVPAVSYTSPTWLNTSYPTGMSPYATYTCTVTPGPDVATKSEVEANKYSADAHYRELVARLDAMEARCAELESHLISMEEKCEEMATAMLGHPDFDRVAYEDAARDFRRMAEKLDI